MPTEDLRAQMMPLGKGSTGALAAIGLMMVSSGSQASTSQPSLRALTSAVNQYLADHGDLCVGKFTWPRIVTPEDRLARTNDAVQLPVLERLGLVKSTHIATPATGKPASSTPTPADAAVIPVAQGSPPGPDAEKTESSKQYSLTEKGSRSYLQKKRITLGVHDQPVEHDADLCVARLTLEKVVKWSPPEQVHGRLETMVSYTYHVKAVDWMADPQAREVFPIVDRIIRNEGSLLMSVTARLQDGKWQPVLPGL